MSCLVAQRRFLLAGNPRTRLQLSEALALLIEKLRPAEGSGAANDGLTSGERRASVVGNRAEWVAPVAHNASQANIESHTKDGPPHNYQPKSFGQLLQEFTQYKTIKT